MHTIYLGLAEENMLTYLHRELDNLGFRTISVVEKVSCVEESIWIVDATYLDRFRGKLTYPIFFAQELSEDIIHSMNFQLCSGMIDPSYTGLRLKASINISIILRNEQIRLCAENQKLTKKLQDRRIIEKAKFVWMKRNRTSEEEAYQKMRMMAMRQQKTLREVADDILLNEE